MKTKYFLVLLIVAIFAAACAPVVTDSVSQEDPAIPPAQENSASIPVTGASVSVPNRDAQEPRLWSGEILNSDINSPDYNPDHGQSIQVPVNATAESACSSEDDLERRQGGCIE